MTPMPARGAALALAVLALLAAAPPAAAHACYVSEGGADACARPEPDPGLLASALASPVAAVALLATLIAPFAAYLLWRRGGLERRFREPMGRLLDTLRSYEDLLPWMLRLSLGISLAAAGAVGYLFTPLLEGAPLPFGLPVRAVLSLLGFMLLLGLLVRPAALATALLFLYAAAQSHMVLGTFEVLGAALTLLVLGGGRPGIDDLLQRTLDPAGRFGALLARRPALLGALAPYTPLVLRVCLAGALAYGALMEKLLNPGLAADVAVAHGLAALAPWPPEGWALLVGAAELLLALLFLAGFLTRATSLATFLVLTATMFYFGENLSSHVTLFGIASWLFTTGGGALSLDRYLHPERPERSSRLGDVPRALPD